MAGNRVVLTFVGEDGPLRRTVDRLGARLGGLNGIAGKLGAGLLNVVKPLALLGAAGNAIQVLAGAAAAAQQLLPIVLLLPGAIAMAAAAMATFKIATAGFAEAVKSGDLSKLSPQARAAATEVRALGKAFEPVKSAVQGAFFKDFAADVKTLGASYLPILGKGLPRIASGFNEMGRSVAFALNTSSAKASVTAVLDSTATLLHNARNAAGGFATGLLNLAGIGATYLPGVGIAIDGVAQKFQRWVEKGAGDGSLRRMIDGAIVGFRDLAAIAGNVGSILGSVFSGLAGGSGASSPLATLRDTTAALAAFFRTAEASGPLQALGGAMASLGQNLRDVLLAAFRALGPMIEALAPVAIVLGDVIGKVLVAAFDRLGPPLTELARKLGPLLIPALRFLGTVIIDYVIPALAGFIGWLTDHVDDVVSFAQSSVIAFLGMGSATLGFVSTFLGGMQAVFTVLSYIPGAFGQQMGAAARATGSAKDSVDGLRGTVDLMRSKFITIQADTAQARSALDGIRSQIMNINGKTVSIFVNARGDMGGIASAGRLAGGGLANTNRSYLVGEQGPEILTMGSQSGYVSPNGGGGGGGGASVTFAGGLDSAFASYTMKLIREGKIRVAA